MTARSDWRTIVAASLEWDQAHAPFTKAVEGLAPNLRGRRPEGFPHSAWELVEHIRIAQRDLLDFMTADCYEEPHWPGDYWPPTPAPPSDAAWRDSIAAVQRDAAAIARFTTETPLDLSARIPRGTGQTYLRTILVAMDHAAYHVGQIVAVRRLLTAWPAA